MICRLKVVMVNGQIFNCEMDTESRDFKNDFTHFINARKFIIIKAVPEGEIVLNTEQIQYFKTL